MSADTELDFARETVESIINTVKKNLSKSLEIKYKSKFDLFTEMDKRVENKIVSSIRKNFPEDDIVTEESDLEQRGSDRVWYLDPISGSTNYAHGLPIYGISLALEVEGEMKSGVIYNSVEDEVFYAEKNKGAFVEGREISVSDVNEIEKAVVSTTFPYDEEERKRNLEYFDRIATKVEGIRRTGSVSVDLTYLALGTIDGFWSIGLEPWDSAAGWLLAEESGGKVTRIDGGDYGLEADSMLVSNREIHEAMMENLKG